ncbi:hypothetical protein HF325_001559 [Metschnikowia pulcherrima]|uniref:Uncharacterized protein n=1 Tax=Metschnikowia pulcherrima TaxID=27326 RepID=A0A8H7GWX6_9ASCO|nr:hypothetical protein HF325_001559 [Metschnikowia pulcherrima]
MSPVAIRNTENIEDVILLTRKFFANVEDQITYIELYKSLKRSSITQEFSQRRNSNLEGFISPGKW